MIETKKIVVENTPDSHSSLAPSDLQRKVHFRAMSALAFGIVLIGSPLVLVSMVGCYTYFSIQRAIQGSGFSQNQQSTPTPPSPGTHRIHFVSSCGGGAHNSLVTAIKQYWQESPLSKQYPVQFDTVLAFGDVFKEFDL